MNNPSETNQSRTSGEQRTEPPTATPPIAVDPEEDKPKASNSGCGTQNANKKEHTGLEKIAFGVAILAFFTGAWQAYVANDTEIVQFRALINEEIAIEPFNGGGIKVVPIFKNSGGTQTKDLWATSMTSPIALPNGRVVDLEPPSIATSR